MPTGLCCSCPAVNLAIQANCNEHNLIGWANAPKLKKLWEYTPVCWYEAAPFIRGKCADGKIGTHRIDHCSVVEFTYPFGSTKYCFANRISTNGGQSSCVHFTVKMNMPIFIHILDVLHYKTRLLAKATKSSYCSTAVSARSYWICKERG